MSSSNMMTSELMFSTMKPKMMRMIELDMEIMKLKANLIGCCDRSTRSPTAVARALALA